MVVVFVGCVLVRNGSFGLLTVFVSSATVFIAFIVGLVMVCYGCAGNLPEIEIPWACVSGRTPRGERFSAL